MITDCLTFLAMSPAPGEGQAGSGQGAMMMNFLFIGMMVLVFYLLIWRPNAQRQKKHKQMLGNLKKGDRIVTNGGLFATVLNVKEDRLVCTIADGVKVEISRSAVSGVIEQ
ncbi:preprotein translocase subunit YajC [bacterium]|nr:preprotein translocase subunit YajC [bacterium]MBU1072846.1 preprotein translocase subunit YajC [bacterium]MBU1674940.1 preprotein translocase subunit YajC [bacterium]